MLKVRISGQHNGQRYRAALAFMKAADLVRLTNGALGGHAAIEARHEFDKLGGMSNAEAVGGPVRTYDHSRFDGDPE